MRPIRPGMPGGPRMPVRQGVGKPTPRPGPENTLPVRPANITPQANQPDPQLQFQSDMRDRLRNMASGMRGMGGMKKGGTVKMKSGSASKRADGIAQRGKTKGRIV